jgi:hypothetical protein
LFASYTYSRASLKKVRHNATSNAQSRHFQQQRGAATQVRRLRQLQLYAAAAHGVAVWLSDGLGELDLMAVASQKA